MYDISKKINELRRIKNISQRELAEKIGMSFRGLQVALEKNDFKVSVLEKIAQVLGVPVGYFFGESGALPERAGSMSDCEKELEMLKALIQEKTERIKLLEQMIAMLQEQCRGRGG